MQIYDNELELAFSICNNCGSYEWNIQSQKAPFHQYFYYNLKYKFLIINNRHIYNIYR